MGRNGTQILAFYLQAGNRVGGIPLDPWRGLSIEHPEEAVLVRAAHAVGGASGRGAPDKNSRCQTTQPTERERSQLPADKTATGVTKLAGAPPPPQNL